MKKIIHIFLALFITLGLLVVAPVLPARADCTEPSPDVWTCDNTPDDTDGMDATTNSSTDTITIDSGATVANAPADITTIDMMNGSLTNNGTVLNNEKSGAAIFAGGDSDITNNGTLSATEESSTAIFTLSGDVTNTNSGSVQANGSSATGILTDTGNVVNNGTVSTNGDGGTGILTDTGNNAVTNNGTVSANGVGGIAILTGPGNDTVTIGAGSIVNGLINGGADTDTLAFAAFTQSQLAGLNPAAGTFGGYSWVNFEQLTGLFNAPTGQIEVRVADNLQATYPVASQSYGFAAYNLNNGPVKVNSTNAVNLIPAERMIYKVHGTNTSFSEVMGLPNSQLNTTYWFPWYNNVDLDTQLRFGNVSGSTATVHVFIAGTEMTGSPFTLLPGASTRVSFAGINNGPVKVESNVNIVAAERVIYKVDWNNNGSFSEMMGLPNSQLNTTYWFPWYNNVDLDTQLRFGNVSGSTATVHVSIGGTPMVGSPFTLLPGQSTRVSFAGVNSGPVQIVSDVNIVAAERVIHKVNDIYVSFSEMMGLPNSHLNTTYWFSRYNNIDLDTQLRFGNVSGSTATVHVSIGGTEMTGSPFTLLPGQSTRVSFAGVNSGPVQVVSDVNIVAAERVIYNVNGLPTSFSEMMGLANHLLDTMYWFPWYNNIDLDTQLRFAVP